jgi:hypothetical protein
MPPRIENDRLRNRKRLLIQPEHFDPETFSLSQLCLCQLDILHHIDKLLAEMCENSTILQVIIEALEKLRICAWPKELKGGLRIPVAECRAVTGKVYFRVLLVIDPDDTNIQLQLIHRTHVSGPGGHPGRVRTLDLMNRKYWWLGMSITVRTYCNMCLLYDKTKTPRSLPTGFLKPLAILLIPWRDISMDYITPLPPYRRKDRTFQHMVVVVDRLTKMCHFIATEGLEVEELAERFIERVYNFYSLPETIVSDRGTQFVSTF